MLSKLFTSDVIKLKADCPDWQSAIKEGTDLLVRKNFIEDRYREAIINNFRKFGPYMVVAPGIVLAHAKHEDGVMEMSMSLVTLAKPIAFGNETNDPVTLVITLAATDHNSHLSALTQLMELLMNGDDINSIMLAHQQTEVTNILSRY